MGRTHCWNVTLVIKLSTALKYQHFTLVFLFNAMFGKLLENIYLIKSSLSHKNDSSEPLKKTAHVKFKNYLV